MQQDEPQDQAKPRHVQVTYLDSPRHHGGTSGSPRSAKIARLRSASRDIHGSHHIAGNPTAKVPLGNGHQAIQDRAALVSW